MLDLEEISEIVGFELDHFDFMQEHGLTIPRTKHSVQILKGIDEYGGCPCILSHPKCPCPYAVKLIEKRGHCHCGLFHKVY